ncbi:MAG TPA: hypothetical protein VFV73_27740 [Streptosporangiaceae bacterium]|nr:hypothetical protein [Streptosporangiaceae bacterium]
MESITKNRQPEQALRAMAERAHGPAQVPATGADWVSELGHGWFNVAYRLRLRDGTRVVLKIAPPVDLGCGCGHGELTPASRIHSAARAPAPLTYAVTAW